ncbi:hypothetical protein AVEN_166517-1 [Araneus ventricosus]|uniref:Uncharacterized protein n=1 Tax=Araneus ventricosus TaxID=182803 RepID=A0A4Y2IRU2_ARAVE|nr:hypothetical protein AVEN_166517-1 [Araneus ventricosus]
MFVLSAFGEEEDLNLAMKTKCRPMPLMPLQQLNQLDGHGTNCHEDIKDNQDQDNQKTKQSHSESSR